MDFTDTWDVVSSPHFDYDYLSMEVVPYVTLRQRGDRMEGRYQVGLQAGYLDGRVHGDFFTFGFEGNDEMEEMLTYSSNSRSQPSLCIFARRSKSP